MENSSHDDVFTMEYLAMSKARDPVTATCIQWPVYFIWLMVFGRSIYESSGDLAQSALPSVTPCANISTNQNDRTIYTRQEKQVSYSVPKPFTMPYKVLLQPTASSDRLIVHFGESTAQNHVMHPHKIKLTRFGLMLDAFRPKFGRGDRSLRSAVNTSVGTNTDLKVAFD